MNGCVGGEVIGVRWWGSETHPRERCPGTGAIWRVDAARRSSVRGGYGGDRATVGGGGARVRARPRACADLAICFALPWLTAAGTRLYSRIDTPLRGIPVNAG